MLQCHRGYKMGATVHKGCFVLHRESWKLGGLEEVGVGKEVRETDWEFVERVVGIVSGKGGGGGVEGDGVKSGMVVKSDVGKG